MQFGGQPIESLARSWSIKMQPNYYAKQFRATFLQCYTTGLVLGPIIGGILAYILC